MLNGRRFTIVLLKTNVYANHLGCPLYRRFWASRLGNGDWESAYLITLITLEKSGFIRTVSVGSSAFCSLILCYFLSLRLSHTDLWLLHDHTTPGPLHCLSTLPGTFFSLLYSWLGLRPNSAANNLVIFEWPISQSGDSLWLLSWKWGFKHRPLEMEASDWKTWRWKRATWLPGEDIPGREKGHCKLVLPGVWWSEAEEKENWKKSSRAQIWQLKEGGKNKKISWWLRITWNLAKNCDEAKTLNWSQQLGVKPGLGTCGLCDLGGAMGQTSWWQKGLPNKNKKRELIMGRKSRRAATPGLQELGT